MKKRLGETSYKDTAFGILPRSKLIPLEIEGIKRVWDYIIAYQKKQKLLITPQFFVKLHGIGFKWIFPDSAGKFRTHDVEVSSHKPPHFFQVPELMESFCLDNAERFRHLPNIDEPIFLDALIGYLSWAHHRFLWIHPFGDFNGRMGRLLLNMILLNMDLPPIELRVETPARRKMYIHALQAADNGDYEKLQKIVHAAINEVAQKMDDRMR